ncbi:MAG: SDR family oxidoreductase [Vicinamibacterales bacterium]
MTDMIDLSGQHALVTGASGGIGRVLASRLAAAGAHVFVHYLSNHAGAAATADAIERAGGRATPVTANLSDPQRIRALFEETIGPRLDILVHNAAIGSFKPLHQVRANQWDLTLNVNARAMLLASQAALPALEACRGKVVALSSLGSGRVIPKYGAIGVSKAALEAVVRYLAIELAPRGIRVNAISAGLVETESVRLHPDYVRLSALAKERTPVGRLVTADDIADALLFLCSPMAATIVGQTLVLDGGASLTS